MVKVIDLPEHTSLHQSTGEYLTAQGKLVEAMFKRLDELELRVADLATQVLGLRLREGK